MKFLPDTKRLGKVYTPDHIVEKMLIDSAVYWASEDSRILDMACGNGRFLIPIVKNILYNTPEQTRITALMGIHGWDIDADALEQCRNSLDKLVSPFGIKIDWNLKCCDALKVSDESNKFDYILSNPPYIRVHNLEQSYREFLSHHFHVCTTGSIDIYFAFFEKAQRMLTPEGTCTLITPNSYMITDAAQTLRDQLLHSRTIRQITNFRDKRIFGTVGTYSAITIFGKQPGDSWLYETCDAQFHYQQTIIPFERMQLGCPWSFHKSKPSTPAGKRLRDICEISVGITTLADHLYIFKRVDVAAHLTMIETRWGQRFALESALLKPIIKGSKLKHSEDPIQEYILFPYLKDKKGMHKIIPESQLQEQYPFAHRYFLQHQEDLNKRDKGKPNPVAWYAFGRAQALDKAFGRKIIFSPINKKPNFILHEQEDCTLYSGYFIKTKGDYQVLLQQLNSDRMHAYMKQSGRNFQGGYMGYNKQIISEFIIDPSYFTS